MGVAIIMQRSIVNALILFLVRSPYLSSVVSRPSPSKRQSPVKGKGLLLNKIIAIVVHIATQILLRKNGFVPIKRKTTTSKSDKVLLRNILILFF